MRVELYADGEAGGAPERHAMARVAKIDAGGYRYEARIAASRPVSHYTPRVVPFHPAASVPLEARAIRWQR